MKLNYLFACLCFISVQATTSAQLVVGTTRDDFLTSVYVTDFSGRPIPSKTATDVEGSPLLSADWSFGSVKLKQNNRRADSIQLQFNLADNTLYFLRDGVTYEFTDDVLEFTINLVKDGKTQTVMYRNGFPAIEKQNDHSFYEVLADGLRVQLLRFNEKKIQESYVYSGPAKKQYVTVSTLYVYDNATKKLNTVKLKRSSVTGALPGLEKNISQLCEQNKWDLKNIEELKLLVQQL